MRIIAGEFRGRKILPPATGATRPITDRAKQSVFDVLSPRLQGAIVYDVFAGTGSLGLECLSRACQHATFFESERSAIALLEQNITTLDVRDRATIVRGDLFQWFARAAEPAQKPDLIFLDPPYRFLSERPTELRSLVHKIVSSHFSRTGLLVFRHERSDMLEFDGLRAVEAKDYGDMRVEFLSHVD